jgi:hypothetical protein
MAKMALPRTFVGFSSTDIHYYWMMCAWKAHEDIDFNFADFQLDDAIDSEDEQYIKRRCREKIQLSDTHVLLIGNDSFTKTTYVKWEVEVAAEKGCRLIGVNLNDCRFADWLCPWFFSDRGALFVPFSSRIVAAALEPWVRPPFPPSSTSNWYFVDYAYTYRGYQLIGDTAVLPEPVSPFLFGKPSWAD